jgi:hypothetical protein
MYFSWCLSALVVKKLNFFTTLLYEKPLARLRVRHLAIVTGTAKTASGLTKTASGLTKTASGLTKTASGLTKTLRHKGEKT